MDMEARFFIYYLWWK